MVIGLVELLPEVWLLVELVPTPEQATTVLAQSTARVLLADALTKNWERTSFTPSFSLLPRSGLFAPE
jgi:hypothetical protein